MAIETLHDFVAGEFSAKGFEPAILVQNESINADGRSTRTLDRVERRSVSDRLAVKVLGRRPAIVDDMPVVAEIPAGVKAVKAPDGRFGLLLEDQLWVLGAGEVAAEVVELNSSELTTVTKKVWDSYKKAGQLRR